MTTTVSRGIPRQAVSTTPVPTTGVLLRPPTLFAQQATEELVRAGHDLARRAIGYSVEKVPFDDAAERLLGDEPTHDALRIAQHFLAYSCFDVPLTTQTDAEFLVENAIYGLEQADRPRRRWFRR